MIMMRSICIIDISLITFPSKFMLYRIIATSIAVLLLIYSVALAFYMNVEDWDLIETSYWTMMTLLVCIEDRWQDNPYLLFPLFCL